MSVTGWPQSEGEDAFLLRGAMQTFRWARPDSVAPFPLGVAVSGGGDSVALLHLLHRAARFARFDLRAVTVDHGLRAASASEAASVAAFCARLGIPHQTLIWQGPAPTGNLMDQARCARKDLIGAWARANGVQHVALGHTADDQAETFLMNLARSSGLAGLAGMRVSWADGGVEWTRPLLHATRADLRGYLRRNHVTWIDDPTNEDDRYARVRARRALAALAPLGITVAALGTTISNLSMAQSALQAATKRAAQAIDEQAGALSMPRSVLMAQPAEITRRLLIAMICWMTGTGYAPRRAKLSHLECALIAGRDATLGGVRFQCNGDTVTVTREPRAVMAPVPLGQIWDHRWRVAGPQAVGRVVGALGAGGLRQCPDWRATGVSRDALIVSPAVWDGQNLVAAPFAAFTAGNVTPLWSATLTPSFGLFLKSH